MRIVAVHRGARDGYHVARALSEAGLLETLVTDVYWPADRQWARGIETIVGGKTSNALRCRNAERLPSKKVTCCWLSGLGSMAASKSRAVRFDIQREATRWCDRALGREAGRIATEKRAALFSYSYYAHSAFSNFRGNQPRILFQLHPHPASVRSILRRERELHPDCASSLDKEWELALPESDYQRLADEVTMAQHWIVASNFTKLTLVENGIPAERIGVVPYGIDANHFPLKTDRAASPGPLRLLFVGTLGQRKGIKYLLEAVKMLPPGTVELSMCGRAVDDLSLFRSLPKSIRINPSISAEGLLREYCNADVFVFPSLAEGFAHVLLEAMASGLPIISTTPTAAPDLIRHGREGFIVSPGSAYEVVEAIEEFLCHPEAVRSMGDAARRRAEHFTWERFRHGVVDFVDQVCAPRIAVR
jgi:glycosyltransferase involved in cell wall biosynthesis